MLKKKQWLSIQYSLFIRVALEIQDCRYIHVHIQINFFSILNTLIFYGRVDPNRSVFVVKMTDETEKPRNYVTACVAQ